MDRVFVHVSLELLDRAFMSLSCSFASTMALARAACVGKGVPPCAAARVRACACARCLFSCACARVLGCAAPLARHIRDVFVRRRPPAVARGRAASSLAGQHVLSAHQFNRAKLEEVIEVARGFAAKMKTTKQLDLLKVRARLLGGGFFAGGRGNGVCACACVQGHILGNMFFEPSTRTASSFHAAMLRLGGQVRAGVRAPPPDPTAPCPRRATACDHAARGHAFHR